MINTLLSLYAAATLFSGDLPIASAQSLAWNNNSSLPATAIPDKKPENISPVIKAKAAIAVDLKNGFILFEKNIFEPLPIASLTKLMTAVIILEGDNLKDVVTVSTRATATPGSKIWLAPGEKITVENLLNAALIPSANDAAAALAEYNSGNVESFVDKMNQKSRELGLFSTYFVNPTGLNRSESVKPEKADKELTQQMISTIMQAGNLQEISDLATSTTQNYSTANDLTILGRYAFGKSFIRRTAQKKELEITSTNERLKHKLKNTNELLNSYLNVLGLKTGTTDEAGECLISVVENEKGNQIMTVVLNSPDRYKETKVLADWIFRSYSWN